MPPRSGCTERPTCHADSGMISSARRTGTIGVAMGGAQNALTHMHEYTVASSGVTRNIVESLTNLMASSGSQADLASKEGNVGGSRSGGGHDSSGSVVALGND